MNSCCPFCPEDNKIYYSIEYKNTTLDTLVITCYKGSFLNFTDIKENIIYPDSTNISKEGAIGVKEEEDPIKEFLSRWVQGDSCWVYHYDNYLRRIVQQQCDTFSGLIIPNHSALLVAWNAPLRIEPADIHHFFNYNSWESWIEKGKVGNDGTIRFTFYESDLTGIPK